MSEVVEWVVDDLKRHSDVVGVLLAGIGESSVRVVVVAKKGRDYYRRGRAIEEFWIEEYFNTFERLIEAIKRKEEAHTYILNSGDILYDPEGQMSELVRLAKRTVLKCKEISAKSGREMWQRAFRSLVEYRRVPDTRIREHVIAILQKEWGKSPPYLIEAQWVVRWVNLNEFKLDAEVLASDLFMKEIGERTKFQQARIMNNDPIEPIIAVKNRWLWLIDGYARLYALTRLGLKESMAYVGEVKRFLGP